MLNWYLGRDAYADFITIKVFSTSDAERRMVPLGVNGQPAVMLYSRSDDDGLFRVYTLQVFTVTAAGISRNTVFRDAEVFASLGMPAEAADL
jgi:RNA polymerase sigma-70 factor (ECF subfamily)